MLKRTLLFLFLFPVLLNGQVMLRGTISDSLTKSPVPFCSFIIKGTLNGGVADDAGRFTISVQSLPVTIVFTMMGYQTKTVTVNAAEPLSIRLNPSAITLRPVTISTDKVLTWHPDDAWNFIDFEFYDDYILSLVSMKGRNRNYLVLMDTLGITVSSLRLTKQADSLYTDCLGAVHLFSGDSVYQVYYDYTQLQLPYASPREQFVSSMLPCRCQSGSYYYFSFYSVRGQQLDYYYIDWFHKGKYEHFLSVHDSDKIISYNENYDIRYFLGRRHCCNEYLEPVDSIIRHMDEYRAQLPLSPREQTWLSPLQSPLVRIGNQIFIVDPVDSLLLSYTGAGQLTGSVHFSCLALKGWKTNELYADELSGALYGRLQQPDGYSVFVRIDPQTGTEIGRVTVENYPFISRPKIRGGYAYFLWKDPYSEGATKMRVVSLR